jgi:hypothetical protein
MERQQISKRDNQHEESFQPGRRVAQERASLHPIHQLRGALGNRAFGQFIQARLKISQSRDEYEKEEDLVPEDVMRMPVASTPSQNASAPLEKKCPICEGGQGNCPKCSNDDAGTPPPPPPPPAHTYTFISRGSYGETAPNFTPPSCGAGAAPGTATMVAGSASPNVNVFPNGTYQVRRDDGVEQTATCTRSAAGLAATTAHENSHAAGARNGAAAANTAAALPQNFDTPALCSAALPAIVAAWNASVAVVWTNEVNHGPGTNPPTAQTFTQENAAGSCTFS